MVTVLLQAPPPDGGGWSFATMLTVAAIVGVLVWIVIVQLDPFTKCRWCEGKPPGSGRFYHRCWWCKGAPELLRPGARLMMSLGMPVPRARPNAKRNKRGL